MTTRHTALRAERRARADDQRRLLDRWCARGDADARRRLIERTLPLVRHVAGRFRGSHAEQEDLVQVGTEGLIKAVDAFEPDRGASFTSYAVPKISGEIKHHLRDRSWDAHVPRTVRERAVRVTAAVARLTARGVEPRTPEIAAEAGIDERQVDAALLAGEAYCADSLEGPTPAGATLADTISAPGDATSADDRVLLAQAMRGLPARERRVLVLRFWGDLTQREIATRMGLSQIQVSRILRAGLDRLRAQLRG